MVPGQRQLNGIHHFAFGSEQLLQEHQNTINRVPLERAEESQPSRRLDMNVNQKMVTMLYNLLKETNLYAKVLRKSNGVCMFMFTFYYCYFYNNLC